MRKRDSSMLSRYHLTNKKDNPKNNIRISHACSNQGVLALAKTPFSNAVYLKGKYSCAILKRDLTENVVRFKSARES